MEKEFLEFESKVLPMMAEYTGNLLYRLRPEKDSFVSPEGELPYEIHFISFDSDEDLNRFLQDERRQELVPLKEASVKSILLVKGQKMG